jgi:hypothetical protein
VLDDLDEGSRLGEASADLNAFLITSASAPLIVFAGPAERSTHERTVIVTKDDEHTCPVKNGVWMSWPSPFTAGMQVTAIWQDKDQRELFRLTSPPLHPGRLPPMFGPRWVTYAPLDSSSS